MSRTEVDPREDKLPQWAQRQLRLLRMDLGDAENKIAERDGQFTDPVIFANPYADPPRPIGDKSDMIEYHVERPDGHKAELTVRVKSDLAGAEYLEVMAHGTLVLRPQAGNVMKIYVER